MLFRDRAASCYPILVAGVVACAGRAPSAAPTPVATCEAGYSLMVRDVIYFGRNRPASGGVTDAEWQGFLDQVVTPRFPTGLTVVAATGQWRGRSGAVEQEPAEILTLFHAGDEVDRRAVAEIAAEYQHRFQQEAVLRERTQSCARF